MEENQDETRNILLHTCSQKLKC